MARRSYLGRSIDSISLFPTLPKSDDDIITVPKKVHKRARRVVEMGGISTWVDQCLYLIGQNITHHKRGDPLLDEAIQSAEALLAILVEMRKMEE